MDSFSQTHDYFTDKIPPKLNADWHRAHRMPERPTLEQRLTWHAKHAQHCRCREMPDQIKAELLKQGLYKLHANVLLILIPLRTRLTQVSYALLEKVLR